MWQLCLALLSRIPSATNHRSLEDSSGCKSSIRAERSMCWLKRLISTAEVDIVRPSGRKRNIGHVSTYFNERAKNAPCNMTIRRAGDSLAHCHIAGLYSKVASRKFIDAGLIPVEYSHYGDTSVLISTCAQACTKIETCEGFDLMSKSTARDGEASLRPKARLKSSATVNSSPTTTQNHDWM